MIINLIRHGKTLANEKLLHYGFTDIGLTESGKTELVEIAKDYKNIKVDKFFTSGMIRANETLQILFGDVDYKTVENLKEINFGKFEMKSYKDLELDEDYIKWIEDVENYEIPSGESFKAFKKRVILGFENLIEECEKAKCENIAIITHSGVISAIMDNYFECDKSFFDWKVENGRGYALKKTNTIGRNYYEI